MLSHPGGKGRVPDPENVQIPNPLIEVASADEMGDYLDFDVPVLEKAVETYTVITADGYARLGQIVYADGSQYRIQYGSGNISGICGAALTDTREIDGVTIECYESGTASYAIWEQDGFAFSYTFSGTDGSAVKTLIQAFK